MMYQPLWRNFGKQRCLRRVTDRQHLADMADARAARRRHRHGDRLRSTGGRGPDRLLRPDQTARDDQRRPDDRPLNQWQVLQDSRVPQDLDAAVEPDSSTGSPANTEKTRRTTTAGPTRHAGPQVEQRTDRRTPEATSRMTCPKCNATECGTPQAPAKHRRAPFTWKVRESIGTRGSSVPVLQRNATQPPDPNRATSNSRHTEPRTDNTRHSGRRRGG